MSATEIHLRIINLQRDLDELLNQCPDMECEICSRLVCPHKDPMHFHHDGCPSCVEKTIEF